MQATSVRVRWNHVQAPAISPIAAAVRSILSVPDDRLDYSHAKLALDALIDPTLDSATALAAIDRLVSTARLMAGSVISPDARLGALRRLIYEPGTWNDGQPFAYDHADPLGQSIAGKLLPVYLATRRGNCVSMPTLFLILADRLGLPVSLATAPLHMFVRYQGEDGREYNLECTSGAHPARTEWYRRNMPMSDRAIESGLYLRTLTKREGVALMATTALEHLLAAARLAEAIEVADAILSYAPRDGYTMAKQATACGELLDRDFKQKYRTADLVPIYLRGRYLELINRNRAGFEAAEELGWQPAE